MARSSDRERLVRLDKQLRTNDPEVVARALEEVVALPTAQLAKLKPALFAAHEVELDADGRRCLLRCGQITRGAAHFLAHHAQLLTLDELRADVAASFEDDASRAAALRRAITFARHSFVPDEAAVERLRTLATEYDRWSRPVADSAEIHADLFGSTLSLLPTWGFAELRELEQHLERLASLPEYVPPVRSPDESEVMLAIALRMIHLDDWGVMKRLARVLVRLGLPDDEARAELLARVLGVLQAAHDEDGISALQPLLGARRAEDAGIPVRVRDPQHAVKLFEARCMLELHKTGDEVRELFPELQDDPELEALILEFAPWGGRES